MGSARHENPARRAHAAANRQAGKRRRKMTRPREFGPLASRPPTGLDRPEGLECPPPDVASQSADGGQCRVIRRSHPTVPHRFSVALH